MTAHQIAFYATIFFLVLGLLLGISGIWIKDFWDSETGRKLIFTDLLLFGTSIAAAVITKWLG